MRRFLAIVLLALLPLQFSWAAVASYCEHETQGAGHFGHHDHDHAHQAGASSDAGPTADLTADASPTPGETGSADGDKAPGAMDLDCGHCHGSCSAMLTWPQGMPGALSTAPPGATLDETGGAHAPTRPERPQWLPLA
ncbi:MAG: hypothetical protein V4795_23475 [Pseudomonadota bacterium]